MSAALLLLAAALCAVPWRSAGTDRLLALDGAPGSRGRSAARGVSGSSGPVAGAARRLSRFAGTVRPAAAASAGPESLARMLDLLAVALTAGLPTHTALAAVSDAVAPADPEVAAPLRAAAARVRLGATPAQAWRDVPGAGAVAPAAPVLARATDGGGSVRAALGHAAQRMRSDADAAAVSRAERAAVLVAGPLGLCFLPAFVCLGIVPVVIGLADGMLPGAWP